MGISALLPRILMSCKKAGTASSLGYILWAFFLLQSYSITASFVKILASFPTANIRITCIYMASHSVALVE